MSRSRRKTYVIKLVDHRPGQIGKKLANKKVRRTKIVGNYGAYKKVFDSWNICDLYVTYWGKKDIPYSVKFK